jgi:hypothetical protein
MFSQHTPQHFGRAPVLLIVFLIATLFISSPVSAQKQEGRQLQMEINRD